MFTLRKDNDEFISVILNKRSKNSVARVYIEGSKFVIYLLLANYVVHLFQGFVKREELCLFYDFVVWL